MIKALKPFSVKVHDLEPSFSRWKPPKVNKLFLEVAKSLKPRRLRRVDKPSDQWIDPGQDTRAQRYQDQGYTWPLIEGTMTDGTAYEIARFVAAPDEVGVVKYCGTFIEVKSGDPAPDNYVVLDSKDPFAMSRHGVFGRFYMRLKQGTYYPLGPQWSGTYPEIYGYGYGPLPVWDDYRFMWGRTANDVWWIVPRNHSLRVYFHLVRGQANIGRILGRMVGFTQPIATLPAAYNVSHGW